MAKKQKKRLTKTETRWRVFAYEWIKHFNGEKAAIAAGYAKNSATVTASRLLTYAKVQEFITEAKKERLERLKIDADWVLKRLLVEADANLSDLFNDENGGVKPVHEWPLIWRQGLVSRIDVHHIAKNENGNPDTMPNILTRLRFSDRIKRIELIGKHINVQAFKDKTETEIPGLKEILEAINGRSRGIPSGEKPE